MAQRKPVGSARAKYRLARRRFIELETEFDKLQRSRPRTKGKKAWKTRRLRTLERQLAAAKGLVTKARKAQSRTRVTNASAVSDAFVPFLTEDGLIYVNPAGRDRSSVGRYWHAVRVFLDTGEPMFLEPFEGKTIRDRAREQRFPFITDPDAILAYHDSFDFGPSFYKARNGSDLLQRAA